MPPQQMSPYEAARARIMSRRASEPPSRSWWDTGKEAIGGVTDALLPSKTLSDYWEGPLQVLKHPIDSAKLVGGSMWENQMQQFDKAGAAKTLSEKLAYGAAGMLPMLGPMAASAGEQIGEGNFARGGGQALGLIGSMYVGSKMKAKPAAGSVVEAAPVRAPLQLAERAGSLGSETKPRFYAGDAGVADVTQNYKRNLGNPNPYIESGTQTLADVGEVVNIPPELAAAGYGEHRAPPISVGKQMTRAAAEARKGMLGDRARQPKLGAPLTARQSLETSIGEVGMPEFPGTGPARTLPGTPSVERVIPQRPREAYYPPEDPNVQGIGDVAPIAQEGPRELTLPPDTVDTLRKMGIPEENIRNMSVEQANKALKFKPEPKIQKTSPRLSRRQNIHGDRMPELSEQGNLVPAATQVAKDLTASKIAGRPYRMLTDNDLMTLATQGDKSAILESIGRKRGDFKQMRPGDVARPGDVDPSQPRPSIRGDERGFLNVGEIAEGVKKVVGKILPKQEKINFDAPLGGDRGNIFHRTVNEKFDTNFANWVNARRATKIEGIIKRREFADLDSKGIQGVHDFQAGLRSGRFKDVGDYFDAKHQQLAETGVKLGFRENYLPQLWENTPDQVFQVQKRLGLQPQFTLERVLENYKKGIEAGLKPKHETIGELMGWYEERANKAIADRQFFDHLRETKQVLPEGKAPQEWKTINPDNFPVQKFKTARGEHVTKNYKAPAPIADAINNYLGEGHEAFRWVGDKASITKNIVLSSGVPLTGINAHGFNIAARHVMANGMLKGGVEAAKYLINPKSAKNWFDTHISMAPDAVKHGLTLTTEEHAIGSHGSTHLLREPKTKVGAVANKAFNKLLETHGKLFEDPLFQNILPAMKLKHWRGLADDMLKGGMEETAAKKAAASQTNELYGGINWEAMQRSRDLQNLMRGLVLAPDWLESQYRLGKGMVNTVRAGAKGQPFDPRGKVYKRAAANLIASYVAADVVNYSINGQHMWDNEPGHALDIKAGNVGGKTRYIRPFGTAADFARLPFDAIAGAAQGDLSTTSNILKNRRSTLTKTISNLTMNTDDFGKSIFGEDQYGRDVPVSAQLGKAGREVGSMFTPQDIKAPLDYATGRAGSAEESILGSVEMPVRYSRESTKQKSRRRPVNRRPRRP